MFFLACYTARIGQNLRAPTQVGGHAVQLWSGSQAEEVSVWSMLSTEAVVRIPQQRGDLIWNSPFDVELLSFHGKSSYWSCLRDLFMRMTIPFLEANRLYQI